MILWQIMLSFKQWFWHKSAWPGWLFLVEKGFCISKTTFWNCECLKPVIQLPHAIASGHVIAVITSIMETSSCYIRVHTITLRIACSKCGIPLTVRYWIWTRLRYIFTSLHLIYKSSLIKSLWIIFYMVYCMINQDNNLIKWKAKIDLREAITAIKTSFFCIVFQSITFTVSNIVNPVNVTVWIPVTPIPTTLFSVKNLSITFSISN